LELARRHLPDAHGPWRKRLLDQATKKTKSNVLRGLEIPQG
jgi:hypothetical protein